MKKDIRRIRRIALITVLLGVTVAGCGRREDMFIDAVRSRGFLRVAVSDMPSALFYQDGETGDYLGQEAELAELIAGTLGVSVQYLPVDRESFAGKLSAGEADIAVGSVMEGSYLTQGCLCSTSYGSGNVYVVTRRGFYAGDVSVFSNKTVGVSVQLAPESANALYAVDGIDLQSYDNIASVSADLAGGAIAGYVCYQPEAEALLEQGDYQAQDAAGIGREEYVILAPAASAELMEGVDEVIRQYLTGRQEDL